MTFPVNLIVYLGKFFIKDFGEIFLLCDTQKIVTERKELLIMAFTDDLKIPPLKHGFQRIAWLIWFSNYLCN